MSAQKLTETKVPKFYPALVRDFSTMTNEHLPRLHVVHDVAYIIVKFEPALDRLKADREGTKKAKVQKRISTPQRKYLTFKLTQHQPSSWPSSRSLREQPTTNYCPNNPQANDRARHNPPGRRRRLHGRLRRRIQPRNRSGGSCRVNYAL